MQVFIINIVTSDMHSVPVLWAREVVAAGARWRPPPPKAARLESNDMPRGSGEASRLSASLA